MTMNKNLRDLAEKANGGDAESLQLLLIEIPGDSPLASLAPEEIAKRLLASDGAEPEETSGLPADEDGDAGTPPDDGEGSDGDAMLTDALPDGVDLATFKKVLRAAEAAGICTCSPDYADMMGDDGE